MQWWGWVLIALAVIVVLVAAVLAIQAKRRSGGVIITGRPGKTRKSGKP